MIDFLTIILLIFGVLQIILFFKVWGMTNDIREIRNKYLKDEDEKRREEAVYDPTPNLLLTYQFYYQNCICIVDCVLRNSENEHIRLIVNVILYPLHGTS